MIVLIVGPSGVGKTSSYQAAESHFPEVVFHHLDGLAARWALQKGIINLESVTLLNQTVNDADVFLSIGLLATGKLQGENPGKHLVVDVGAGFQVSPTAAKLHRVFQIIAITAEPMVAFSRIQHGRNDQRTFEQYRSFQKFCDSQFANTSAMQHRKNIPWSSDLFFAIAVSLSLVMFNSSVFVRA